MTNNNERDPRRDPNDPLTPRRPSAYGSWLPFVLAALVAVAVIAWTTPDRTGYTTNTGPSIETVAPTPSPSTSPAVPTPNPTTEQPPAQAPQP